jgi:23S rRNA (uracil1939-C5)-methyltransferase
MLSSGACTVLACTGRREAVQCIEATNYKQISEAGMDPIHHFIEIERLALLGDGVGRITTDGKEKGKVAFVSYSMPKEKILAKKVLDQKTYSRWIPQSIVEESLDRIEPACPYHFRPGQTDLWCGGCNWQHFSVEKQREVKRDLVIETLERLGGISDVPVTEVLFSEKSWRYRNNVQIVFGKRAQRIIGGFYAPGTHDIVPIDDCLIQSQPSVHSFTVFKETAGALRLQPYEREADRGWLKHLVIRTNEAGEALLVLVTKNTSFPDQEKCVQLITAQCPEVVSIYQNVQPARINVMSGKQWIHLWGSAKIEEHLCNFTIACSPEAFLQVNTQAASLLYRKAMEEVKPEAGMTVLDLYCGVGCLTLVAARSVEHVIGIEELPAAIDDARENARENGIGHAEFFASTVEGFLERSSSRLRALSNRLVVIVDPPRSGCRREVISQLLTLTPRRIVYISCDPATLARDLKVLSKKYHLSAVTVVDLFPQTSHIEVITRLEKKRY